MRRWTCAAVTALVVCALALAGCGDPDETGGSTSVSSSPDADASAGPGTPLVPGVEVVDGSRLVGRVFPWAPPDMGIATEAWEGRETGTAPGWQALLVVDGDPVEVWDRYAAALGVPEASAVNSCTVDIVTAPDITAEEATTTMMAPETPADAAARSRFLTEPVLAGENLLNCSAHVGDVSMFLKVGASRTCVSGADGSNDCSLRPLSHLMVRVGQPQGDQPSFGTTELRYERGFAAAGPDGVDGGPETWPAVPEGDVVAPQLADLGPDPRRPAAGDPLDDGIDPFLSYQGSSVFAVPPGARSLVAPALVIECNSGLVAVLRMPGNPADAIAYFDGAADLDDPITASDGTTEDGRTWVTGMIATAGGYYLGVTAVAHDDSSSDVLVDECGD